MKYSFEFDDKTMTAENLKTFKRKLWGALRRLADKAISMGADRTDWGLVEGEAQGNPDTHVNRVFRSED